jgi:hypothetical protein
MLDPDPHYINTDPQPCLALQVIDFGKAIDLRLEGAEAANAESEEKQQEEGETAAARPEPKGRTGKYHLDYFGIAGM